MEPALALAAANWGVVMGLSPVLQIRRMLRSRSSADVSVGYFAVLNVGFVLWVAYGLVGDIPALVWPNGVALVMSSATIVVALALRRREAANA